MKIWAHTIVKNEARYVWFAVMSVINHVDKVLLWDTGSTDGTDEIIKEIKKRYPEKVVLKFIGNVDIHEYTQVRQQMLEQTIKKADWFIVVDGDEVWWDESIKEIIDVCNSNRKIESVVTRFKNMIGDIYHYQEEAAGKYNIDGHKGHLTIRAMSTNIPGLHQKNPHGTHGFFDESGVLVQERDSTKRFHIMSPGYLHFTNLTRSLSRDGDLKVSKRSFKYKYEIGNPVPLDYYYPEVFFRPYPQIVPSPWSTMKKEYYNKALVQTPLRKVKRRILNDKIGY